MKQKGDQDPMGEQRRQPQANRDDRHGPHQRSHSATAQFFINVADNDFLNHRSPTWGWGYCVLVASEGLDVVNKIQRASRPVPAASIRKDAEGRCGHRTLSNLTPRKGVWRMQVHFIPICT